MADKLLKSIKFPTLPDRYVIGDTTLTEEGAAADAKAVGEALATKADTKGRYENIVAGGAEQLMADGYESDSEPYLFRPTGGSADVGNREYLDKIVGGTVAWNQLTKQFEQGNWVAENGVTIDFEDDVLVVSSTIVNNGAYCGTPATFKSGHKYLVTSKVKTETNLNNVIVGGVSSTGVTKSISVQAGQWVDNSYVAQSILDGTSRLYCYARDTQYSNLRVKDFMVFDLTALFNPTIADYIYSLEQSQAGAGVAWFRKLFPADYYEYNTGELMHVEGVSSHDTVGFNLWDEEYRTDGYYENTGKWVSANNLISAKNFIPVLPSTSYYIHLGSTGAIAVTFWDANKSFIARQSSKQNIVLLTPSNCHYILFNANTNYGTTYKNDICINLSDPSRNGEYEPYSAHTYPLDSSLTLRGVPKLDSFNNLYYDGDTYASDGTVTRKYGVVDLGTLTWYFVESQNCFYTYGVREYTKQAPNAVCSKYPYVGIYADLVDKSCGYIYGNAICVRDESFNEDTAAFKTAMSGVYFVYELATPTTETADGYEHYQICDPSGTEEFVTTGIVPVGHETRYPHDLKKKLETAPDSPSADGTYLMKRSGGKNTYMALPSTPSANGAYVLTVTVSGGTASYSWTAKG